MLGGLTVTLRSKVRTSAGRATGRTARSGRPLLRIANRVAVYSSTRLFQPHWRRTRASLADRTSPRGAMKPGS